MLRKWIYTVVVAGLAVGFAHAQNQAQQPNQAGQANQVGSPTGKDQPLWGRITKVDGDKVLFSQYNPETRKFGDAREYPITGEDFRVFQMKGKDRLPLTGGLKGEPFQNIGEQGLYGSLRVNNNNIGEIQLYPDEAAFQQGLKTFQPNPGVNPGAGNK
jgi:hypothetical protein